MYDLLKLAFNGREIRTVVIDGNPWFVGADVLSHLYGKASGKGIAHDRLAPDQKRKVNRIDLGEERGGKPMTVIAESGLYRLVSRSDKAQARPFQDWATRIVLPAIRKDGGHRREIDLAAGRRLQLKGIMGDVVKRLEAIGGRLSLEDQKPQFFARGLTKSPSWRPIN